jgi:hypothetical protein
MKSSHPLGLAALLCFTLSASAADKPMPAVKRILDKTLLQVKKNRQEFAKANEIPFADARRELQALAKQLVDDGKTEEAAAVLKQVGTLEADLLSKADVSSPAPAPAPAPAPIKPAPQKPFQQRLVGAWTHPNSRLTYYFELDGSFHENWRADGKVNATGTVVWVTPEVAVIKMTNNYKIRVTPAGEDRLALLVWDELDKPVDLGMVLERSR